MKAFVIAALALALTAPAFAQEAATDTLPYRVRQGDTLDVVSAEFYGDKNLAMFVATENKLADGKTGKTRSLRPGEKLRVPVAHEVATAKGDRFESLAQTYLGDAKRAEYLAEYNGISLDQGLAAGTVVAIPMHVTHTAAQTESLATIAVQYLGDAKQADMLRRFNNLDKNTIDKGDTLIVPALKMHSTKVAPLDAEGKDRRDKQKKAMADVAEALPRARSAWMVGDFAQVKAALAHAPEEAEYLDVASAVECGLLLGKARVAFDETDAAVAAFALVLDRVPRHMLSPYADSPKVLAAWRKAGGHVEGE